MILVGIPFQDDAGHNGSPREPARLHEAAGGCALVAAWGAVVALGLGAGMLLPLVITRNTGAFGWGGIYGLFIAGVAVVSFGLAAIMWTVHRLRHHPSPRWRRIASTVAIVGSVALMLPFSAVILRLVELSFDTWTTTAAGATFVVLGGVLAADRPERRPALAFATIWVLLVGTIGYRAWLDDQAVVALGIGLLT